MKKNRLLGMAPLILLLIAVFMFGLGDATNASALPRCEEIATVTQTPSGS